MPEEAFFKLPDSFPNDECYPYPDSDNFDDFKKKYIEGKFPTGSDYLQEVYISKATLLNILKDVGTEKCAGVVVYCAKIDVEDPNNPGKKVNSITLAAVGVDGQGHLFNGKGATGFYVTQPCPPYCPTWK
jgi:hypothetical protein